MPRAFLFVGACATLVAPSRRARAEDARPVVELTVPRAPGLPVLESRAPGSAWAVACIPPCTLRLTTADDYRIGGDGVVDSDTFHLPPADRVHVEAKAGSTMVRGIGTLFEVGGMVFVAGGGAILLVPADSNATESARTDKTIVGAGFIAMGLATAALGVVLRLLSDTTVRVEAAP